VATEALVLEILVSIADDYESKKINIVHTPNELANISLKQSEAPYSNNTNWPHCSLELCRAVPTQTHNT
jgi:hypothetical protein